jgi:Flp pilus assembly protein TadD
MNRPHTKLEKLALLAGAAIMLQAVPTLHAQEVVQPLPPEEIGDLNAALQRLARNPRDVAAMVDAGEASLAVGDTDAAVGFFTQAEEISPQNPRIMLGLARASVRARDPLKAIGLFNAAEQAGASMKGVGLDRGLAYDLVGDAASAQAEYRKALAEGEDDETRRRLSLSLAIAGDRKGFEEMLNPLVARGDSASYRTRAFGLAILGDEDEAVAITDAVMPREMSARMEPYLRYMKRLTPAQQASAGNLGVFPRAAQIGRDTPQVAQYREQNGLLRSPDARLAPQGEPLGRRADATSQRRRPDRGRSVASQDEPAGTGSNELPEAVQREVARAERRQASDPLRRSDPVPVVVRRIEPKETPPVSVEPQPTAVAAASSQPEQQAPPVVPTGVAVTELPPSEAAPTRVAVATPAVEPGFDLAKLPSASAPAAQVPAPPEPSEEERQEAASVAEAFAAFANPAPRPVSASNGGVDITRIKPPREVEKADPPPPPKPVHPSRHWVQVATGRDVKALGFDWRRLSRKAPDVLGKLEPHVTPWGEANRLLAGPYASREEARKAMNSLKELGIESFTYVSPEGQEIRSID